MSGDLRELVERYADAVTDRDEAAWAATWTDDARWDLGGGEVVGRDAVVAAWRGAMARLDVVVQTVQHGVTSIDGDEATGRWTIQEVLRRAGNDAPELLLGRYHDTYRRQPDGWRIARRRLEVLLAAPLGSGRCAT